MGDWKRVAYEAVELMEHGISVDVHVWIGAGGECGSEARCEFSGYGNYAISSYERWVISFALCDLG